MYFKYRRRLSFYQALPSDATFAAFESSLPTNLEHAVTLAAHVQSEGF
jgi:hypothetical protein